MEISCIRKQLGVNHNTPIFVLLTAVTFGFYFFYWALNTVKEVVDVKDKKILTILVIAFVSIQSLYSVIPDAETMYYATQDSTTYYIFHYLDIFVGIVVMSIGITTAIFTKKHIINYFAKNNINIEVKTVWCVIFNFYYYYYLVNKISSVTSCKEVAQENDTNIKKECDNE